MSDVIISVENLGKKYRIRHEKQQRYTALRDVIAAKFAAPWRGLRRLTSDLRPSISVPAPPAHEDFWALKDVSFEIKQGEVVGIIGRNGAGKSTLLKILSRITEPTTGKVKIKGRVASLLEVGTGFHPELTGRENIFLNGAILGMTRIEIRRKFDEIVAFAEVEQFLDTAVKHYSSGMYVRLAFAVAAHLEPEILIVDEVLAVGDAEFQRKCLGKIQDASKGGRTVLFVSHNMAAVNSLCRKGILLDKGSVQFLGKAGEAISKYTLAGETTGQKFENLQLSQSLSINRLEVVPGVVQQFGKVVFILDLNARETEVIKDLALLIHAQNGGRTALIDLRSGTGPYRLAKGEKLLIRCQVEEVPFVEGDFKVGLYVTADSISQSFMDLLNLTVLPNQSPGDVVPRDPQFRGVVELRTRTERTANNLASGGI